MRVLSYDIECVSLSGVFPKPETDPITNINFILAEVDNPEIIVDVGLVLGSVPVDAGRTGNQRIFFFETEKEMLDHFGSLRLLLDPDIETHYNGKNFDEPECHHEAGISFGMHPAEGKGDGGHLQSLL